MLIELKRIFIQLVNIFLSNNRSILKKENKFVLLNKTEA